MYLLFDMNFHVCVMFVTNNDKKSGQICDEFETKFEIKCMTGTYV